MKSMRMLTDGASVAIERQYEEFSKATDNFLNKPLDPSVVKLYPGSPKGPHPDDDPEFYIEWYIRNLPKELTEGMTEQDLYHNLGIKMKKVNVTQKEDDKKIEYTQFDAWSQAEGIEPMLEYDGIPEWEIFEDDF